MKTFPSVVIAAALAALIASAPAMAQHRGHHHGGGARFSLGIGIGPGFGFPNYAYRPPYYYYPAYPPYYYPPVAIAPAPLPVYIERQDVIREQFMAQPQTQQQQYQQSQVQPQVPAQAQAETRIVQSDWFYCADSKTYYPYVQQCAGQWQRVTPHPPAR